MLYLCAGRGFVSRTRIRYAVYQRLRVKAKGHSVGENLLALELKPHLLMIYTSFLQELVWAENRSVHFTFPPSFDEN